MGWGGWGGTGIPRQCEAGPSCSRPGGAEPLCPQEPSLYTVKALLILDSRGQRLLAKVKLGPGLAAVVSPLRGGRGAGSGHSADPPPASQYYDSSFPTAQEQAAFESSIFSKTRGAGGEHGGSLCSRGGLQKVWCARGHPGETPSCVPTGEIAFLEGLTVVYRSSSDLLFYVVGGPQENEVRGAGGAGPTGPR